MERQLVYSREELQDTYFGSEVPKAMLTILKGSINDTFYIFFLLISYYCPASARPKQYGSSANGESADSKKKITASSDVLKGLVEWLCIQVCHEFFTV